MELRRIPLENPMNLRDLGGYPAENGAVTPFGVFFRSDALCGLTEQEVQFLRELGVQTVIDLRSPGEAAKYPCSLKGVDGVAYCSIPFSIGNRSPQSPEQVPDLYMEIA